MKKTLSLLLVVLILSTSLTSFGQIEEKLNKHWSENMIKKDFVAYYFPYLARNDFQKFSPDTVISGKDFALSLGSLLKDYDIELSSSNVMPSKPLTRKEIVNIIGRKLVNVEELNPVRKKNPFRDTATMTKEGRDLLNLLYSLEILYGVSSDSFAPDKVMTQAEAIIILQRVEGVLAQVKEISFVTKGVVQSKNSQENVTVRESGNKVLVTVTKMFPTPGYGIGVDKIVRDGGRNQYKILLDITPPKEGTILPQVITYKTITIEVDKNQLGGQGPYNFTVDGIKSNLWE